MRRRVTASNVLESIARSRFLILLLCLLGIFMVQPMLPQGHHGLSVLDLDVGLAAVLIASIWSLSHSRALAAIGLAFVVPALIATFFGRVGASGTLALVGLGCALAFIAFTAASVLWLVVRRRDVDADTILGGICVYLLVAALWAGIYSMLVRVDPGAFSVSARPAASDSLLAPEALYYSVLIITTMGPEDVQPLSRQARAWTGLEAIVGQLYLAVFIARLVGMSASGSGK